MIIRYATAEHYSLEVQFLAEFLPVFIHPSAKAQSAVVGMDEHLYAVEDVSVGLMGVKRLVASDLSVCVVALDHIVVDDDAERATHNFVVGDDDHLPFREDGYELLYLLVGPEYIAVAVYSPERFSQLVVILHP